MATSSAVKKNSAQAWVQFAIVFICGIAMGMFKVPVNMGNIMEYYGATMTEVSLLMSVVGITCLVTALPAGGIMQKVGVKKFGVLVIACGIAENIIGAFAPNITVLILSRLLDAVSYGCLSMVSVAIISANFTSEKRGMPNGIWVIWVALAQLLVAQVANMVVPSFGWQGEWIAVAVCQAVALALFLLFVKNPDQQEGSTAGAAKEKPSVLEGLKEPGPWLLTLSIAGLAIGCSVYTGLYPMYLTSPLGAALDAETANNLVSIGSIGGIVGSVLVGWVINRFKPTKRGMLLIIVAAVSIVCFAFCFNMPVAFAWIPDILRNPKTLAMATGILMIGANIGGALGVTLPSMFIDAAGGEWAACLPCVVGLAVFGLLCAMALHVYTKRKVLPVRPDLEGK